MTLQTTYQQKLVELQNAPKFRKYVIEILEYIDHKEKEPDLTWKKFKKRKYNNKYEYKKRN
jgi:hypothetical protein